jgi:hypothetical protein
MKKNLLFIISFLSGIAVTATISWKSNNSDNMTKTSLNYNIKNPETLAVIAIRKVKLKSGASAEAFEKWAAKLANDEYGKVPGVKYYVAKGERGGEIGSYIYVVEFDSKQTRDFYYPAAAPMSPEATKLLQPWQKFADELEKMAIIEIVNTGKENFTDYIVLE